LAPTTEIIAHRGASAGAVDNSLEAFERAITLRADRIEFDVRRTADDELIAFHDGTLDGAPVRALTRDEIARRTGHLPPTIDEVLELARGRIGLDVEMKEGGYVGRVVDALRAHDDVLITSFIDEVLVEVKALDPAIRTGLLLGRERPQSYLRTRASELFPAQRLRAAKVDFVAPYIALVRAGVLGRLGVAGMPALVWTVNETAAIAKLLDDHRVAGIITDVPERALQLRR
jgi:glycerophosphoryl diester phosphodiesterase